MPVGHRILVLVADGDHFCASVAHDEVELRLHAACVYRNARDAVAERPELRDEYLRGIGRAHRYGVFFKESERGEGLCGHIDLQCELRP